MGDQPRKADQLRVDSKEGGRLIVREHHRRADQLWVTSRGAMFTHSWSVSSAGSAVHS